MYSRLSYVFGSAMHLRVLYSIYTGREIQYNTINNYTQSILPTFKN
jgi:hypothetical protein